MEDPLQVDEAWLGYANQVVVGYTQLTSCLFKAREIHHVHITTILLTRHFRYPGKLESYLKHASGCLWLVVIVVGDQDELSERLDEAERMHLEVAVATV